MSVYIQVYFSSDFEYLNFSYMLRDIDTVCWNLYYEIFTYNSDSQILWDRGPVNFFLCDKGLV
jgi:hypothetical protein